MLSGVSCSRQWRRCLLRSLLRSGSWRAQGPVLSAQSGELYWYHSCLFPTSQFRVRITATKQSRLSAFVLVHLEGLTTPSRFPSRSPRSPQAVSCVLCVTHKRVQHLPSLLILLAVIIFVFRRKLCTATLPPCFQQCCL